MRNVRRLLLPTTGLALALMSLWFASYSYSWTGLLIVPPLGLLALLTLISALVCLIRRLRYRTSDRLREYTGPIALGFMLGVTWWVWTQHIPLRLRFAQLKPAFDAAATDLMKQSSATKYEQVKIGGVTVLASFRNEQGVWFRTLSHPDGAYGFFKSQDGTPPHADTADEQISGTPLGDSWYFYRVRHD